MTNKKWSKVSQTLFSLCNYSGNETKTTAVHVYGACSEEPMQLKSKTENYLNIFNDYPYIFNLGHGVLPETKPETIEYIIQIIRNKK